MLQPTEIGSFVAAGLNQLSNIVINILYFPMVIVYGLYVYKVVIENI